jgi:two-component system response regulator GlrR
MPEKRKILIVDDDKDFVRGLALRLKTAGFDVATAPDAIAAVSTARKESPDLILLDYALPGGTGLTVLDRFKSLMVIAPIIVLSASEILDLPRQATNAGAFAFLRKPVDNSMLLRTIQRALGDSAASAS